MRSMFKFMFLILKNLIIFVVLGASITACVQNTEKIVYVEQFKQKGVFQPDISTDNIKYYLVESDEEREAFIPTSKDAYPGVSGDILVSTQATLINPFVSDFISFFAGGHAALCIEDYHDFETTANKYYSVEATGLNPGDNPAEILDRFYWLDTISFTEVIGLRVKMTEEEKKIVISDAISQVGDNYNFSFIFDTVNKKYCTDIIVNSFKKIGKNLNKDEFATSVYDLIVSSDTYISYYHYFDENHVKHIYYLG